MLKLNPKQKAAVEFGTGPLLIVAGAGTGKTTVVTQRIQHLIARENVNPDQILALTFTEKAAKEMEERVDKIMPYGYTQMWISTFHSFCDMILRQEAINIGLNPGYKLIGEGESVLLFRKHLFEMSLSYYRPLGNPVKFIEAILQHFSRLKDEDITPEEYMKYIKSVKKTAEVDGETLTKEQLQELATCYRQFEEIKIKEGVMDFGDLIANTLRLFRKRENILKKYQDKFKFILVDEFQDTNYAQNELAIMLSGTKKNITVVADDDQAIYRWRGAALSNILQFRINFPGAKIISLTQNYRSTQNILDAAYTLIQNNNPNRLEATEKISKKLSSERNIKGKPIEVIFENRLDEEAEKIGLKITELVESKKYIYKDIAILVRANNHAHPISQYLQRQRIPYQFLGPGQLFHQDEIKDLIAYLKVLADLTDSISLFRVLSMEYFDINQRDLNYLLALSKKKNLTLFETLNHLDETYISDLSRTKIRIVQETILRHIERVKQDSAGQILYYFMTDTGMYQKFLRFKTQREEKIALNIAKFFDRLKAFEINAENANVYAVVDWIDLMTQLGESPIVSEIDFREMNAVNILTVHSSKGLEFPVVFLVNLVNDRFPGRERREKIPVPSKLLKTKSSIPIKKDGKTEVIPQDFHLQEERRLFYVAITRAKDLLIMTGSKFYGEGRREKKLSPFVFEALPQFVLKDAEEDERKQLNLLDISEQFKLMDEKPKNVEEYEVHTISYSALQAFDICPLHYKARYIVGIPTVPSSAQSFGIALHETLSEFYKKVLKKEPVTQKLLLELLEKNWVSEGYQSRGHEKEARDRAYHILTTYFKDKFDKKTHIKEVEMKFSFHLGNNLRVIGTMDRVDELPDGTIEIIDYKTGSINSSTKTSYLFQLGLYGLAVSKINKPYFKKNLDKIKLTLLYVETGETISRSVTEKDLKEVEEKILARVKKIEQSDFKCNKNILCATCEYRMLCSVAS